MADEAWRAVEDPDERQAFLNAYDVGMRIREEKRVAARRGREAGKGQMWDRREQKKAWVKRLEERGWKGWGFVCFRTSYGDQQAWIQVKDRLAVITAEALAGVAAAEAIRGKWKIIYVEDEALDDMPVDGLRENFANLVGEWRYSRRDTQGLLLVG